MADPFAALNASCVAVLGQPVAYQPATGEAFAPSGIFEKATDEERHADGVYARLFLNLADCPVQPAQGDEVTVGGAVYKVFDVTIDVSGGVRLALREV
jgi:hypothetical protein